MKISSVGKAVWYPRGPEAEGILSRRTCSALRSYQENGLFEMSFKVFQFIYGRLRQFNDR
jgi:hypothetical protein